MSASASFNPLRIEPLHIREMRVIWRDTFIIDPIPADFLSYAALRMQALPCYASDSSLKRAEQSATMQVMERASKNVARTGYGSVARFQFRSFAIANLQPTLDKYRLPPDALPEHRVEEAVRKAVLSGSWFSVLPILIVHRSGVGIMQYHVTFSSPVERPYTPEEAIELVRMGISPQLVRLPDSWRRLLPEPPSEDDQPPNGPNDLKIKVLLDQGQGDHVTVIGLRDISQHLIAARLHLPHPTEQPRKRHRSRRARRQAHVDELVRLAHGTERPTGSATVMLVECDPMPGTNFNEYVQRYAPVLRGIGAMDAYYQERAPWLVERELFDNYSTDTELALYLLGNSELILFNDTLRGVLPAIRKRLHVNDDNLAILYEYMHYTVLLEWIYVQEAILKAYLQRLDRLSASGTPRRQAMVGALQAALSDMVQYQETITPYANRIEFLERAGVYHKLDRLADRFERKQQLLLTYSSEYHDFREARAAFTLNFLAGALATVEVASIVIPIFGLTPEAHPVQYGIVMLTVLAVVMGTLYFILRRR